MEKKDRAFRFISECPFFLVCGMIESDMKDTILLVEDDFALAMGTEYALQAEGYNVIHAGSLEKAREALEKEPDLILLDVMLPDGNGFDFCREIRQDNQHIPIIFLTAVGEEVNIVQGLETGADDYVTKPYRVRELFSRITANLRRSRLLKESSRVCCQFGSHQFYPEEFRLLFQGKPVECTTSELRLLRELVKHEGVVLTRSQLLERLYDTEESFVDDNTLSVYMKRLRNKLGTDADWIETVRGIGYRFRKRK
ncbi:MAG: response regulator transcription factor [Clostridium sp.]|nr:response regulator transcription factor [Clostridium sp.]